MCPISKVSKGCLPISSVNMWWTCFVNYGCFYPGMQEISPDYILCEKWPLSSVTWRGHWCTQIYGLSGGTLGKDKTECWAGLQEYIVWPWTNVWTLHLSFLTHSVSSGGCQAPRWLCAPLPSFYKDGDQVLRLATEWPLKEQLFKLSASLWPVCIRSRYSGALHGSTPSPLWKSCSEAFLGSSPLFLPGMWDHCSMIHLALGGCHAG